MLRLALPLPLLLFAHCAVDRGTTATATACAASPGYFVSDVYPRYLEANQCGSAGCHDFDHGHGVLRLRAPERPAPAAQPAIESWPLGWRENYLSAIHLLRCDAPLESRLLRVPEGDDNLHPPGPVVLDRATAAALLQSWVELP
jgi:hypothetical protein